MAEREDQEALQVYGIPVEGPPSKAARLSRALFIAGLLLAVFGPWVGWGIGFVYESGSFIRVVGDGLVWVWWAVLLLGGGVGVWGARRDRSDDESRRYGRLNLITLGVVVAIWVLLFGRGLWRQFGP